jgi:alkylhydroperoxidase family enzyme
MSWNSWNEEEGELTARERLIAILAFKIAMNVSLTQEDSVAQLSQLPDEDVFDVLKMVALFTYWQQLTDSLSPELAGKPSPASNIKAQRVVRSHGTALP